jgi:hypothetical protein
MPPPAAAAAEHPEQVRVLRADDDILAVRPMPPHFEGVPSITSQYEQLEGETHTASRVPGVAQRAGGGV